MLAVQKPPRMGSAQTSSDPFMPFGYSVDHNAEPPTFGEPPEPAPGAPLLTDNDSQFLSSFFNDMSSNHYNMPSFGEGLNFSESWLDLPPTFMGSATSFGTQASLPPPSSSDVDPSEQMDVSRMMPASRLMPPPPHPSQPQQQSQSQQQSQPPLRQSQLPQQQQQQQQQQQVLSQHQKQRNQQQQQIQHPQTHAPQRKQSRHHEEEVLTAAATLVQNGANSKSPGEPVDPSARRPMGPPVGHLRHQQMEEFKQEQREATTTGGLAPDNTFQEWVFSSRERQTRGNPMSELHWGSDINFAPAQAYKATPSSESVASQHAEQMKFLDSFDMTQSTGNTRQNSPLPGSAAAVRSPGSRAILTSNRVEEPDHPRKRRKSKVVKIDPDEEDEEHAALQKANGRRRKSLAKGDDASSPSADSNGKRKKSIAGANSRTPRENLTEEQKRENHIKSEQKRRTLIKVGFDDLCELVPGLRGGGFSKSTMLSMAGEWLEELLDGNKTLTAQLAQLEG